MQFLMAIYRRFFPEPTTETALKGLSDTLFHLHTVAEYQNDEMQRLGTIAANAEAASMSAAEDCERAKRIAAKIDDLIN